jgi:hypothetical protein
MANSTTIASYIVPGTGSRLAMYGAHPVPGDRWCAKAGVMAILERRPKNRVLLAET